MIFDLLKFSDRAAYRVGDTVLSYRELHDQAAHLADLLRREGTSPVLLYGHKEPMMPVAMIACLMAKRPYVPIEAAAPPERIADIRRRTQSTLTLAAEPIAGGVSLSEAEAFALLPPKECDSPIAYIIFTSGSTGEPKGVPILRENLENFTRWITVALPAEKPLYVLDQASFSFDLSVADLFYALHGGHTLIAYESRESLSEVNLMVVTPTFLSMCLCDGDFDAAHFPKLSAVYCCGERLEVKIAQKLFSRFGKVALYNAYGPTEATSAVCLTKISPALEAVDGLLPVGDLASAATEISVEDGEIVLRGDSVFKGYLGTPDPVLSSRGYRTGDFGFVRDGKLYCCGRRDRQIKYKGYRIELDGVERVLEAVRGVDACAVVARYRGDTVKLLKAFYCGSASEESVRGALKRRLPAYMIPKLLIRLEKLPQNAHGKIDRRRLENDD